MKIIEAAKTMFKHHMMPFGTAILHDGSVRFRLWAPKAKHVGLCLPALGVNFVLPMQQTADGWFELSTDLAGCGTDYGFVIDGERRVADPASRCQADDVHGLSRVIDPTTFVWSDHDWPGRPWEEAVIYELHIGCFTPEGTFKAARAKLDYLAALGVTALQLMPIAQFPGERNWGYDGVLPFAVENRYGSPEDLKALIQAAHSLGLMVFLDVVYNHFGPEGNYLQAYAPSFFTPEHQTPWGDAINFDGRDSYWVRQFFIHNALYWLGEFHADGLRLDAVHAMFDASQPDFVEELADTVRHQIGHGRKVHLILENDNNTARYLIRDGQGHPSRYAAQWNDDIHHVLHLLLTGEDDGYYGDYADDPIGHLGRCLCEGFAFQGETSAYRNGKPRGDFSGYLPPTAFVDFLQNHDQIGNRAFGERINALAKREAIGVAMAVLLLAPAPPLLFMGQEWGSRRPFVYFCDFEPDLGKRVTAGRRQEFARLRQFKTAASRERIPDPLAKSSFEQSKLDWEQADSPKGQRWLGWHRALLDLRRQEIMPRLAGIQGDNAEFDRLGNRGLSVRWRLGDGSRLALLANLGEAMIHDVARPQGRPLLAMPENTVGMDDTIALEGWSVFWFLDEPKSP